MIRSRAVLLSLLAHAIVLGAIGWRSFVGPQAVLRIQAPLGDVFVEEQGSNPEAAAGTHPIPAPAIQATATAAAPAAASGGTPSAPGVTTGEARPIGEIRPAYPAISRKLGEEGEAVFTLRIAPSGQVEEATLEKTSGHDRLDQAAKAALLAARFAAENKRGIAVQRFRVEFKLSNSR